jgi:hypothetical protein
VDGGGGVHQRQALDLPNGDIDVNVDDLSSFRAMVDREVNQLLTPAMAKVEREHCLGAGFGQGTLSSEVNLVQQHYRDALVASAQNMRAYAQIAIAIVRAIEEVMLNYTESDLTAQALIDKINAEIGVQDGLRWIVS